MNQVTIMVYAFLSVVFCCLSDYSGCLVILCKLSVCKLCYCTQHEMLHFLNISFVCVL